MDVKEVGTEIMIRREFRVAGEGVPASMLADGHGGSRNLAPDKVVIRWTFYGPTEDEPTEDVQVRVDVYGNHIRKDGKTVERPERLTSSWGTQPEQEWGQWIISLVAAYWPDGIPRPDDYRVR